MLQTLTCILCVLYLGCVHSQGTTPGPIPPTEEQDTWYAHETHLKNDLMKSYDPTVPPLVAESDNITVRIGLAMQTLDSLDERTELLTTHVWLSLSWKDARLHWNKDDYFGLDFLTIPSHMIWLPDIKPYNGFVLMNGQPTEYQYKAHVSQDGSVMFIPQMILQTSCSVDLTYYPFDQQTCVMKFGSWVHSGEVIVLKEGRLDMSSYNGDTRWRVWDAGTQVNVKKYECCPEKYYDFTAKLGLQRVTATTVNLYMGPAVCFGLLIPAVFLLPAWSNHKLILGSALIVSQTLMLQMLLQVLPTVHSSLPGLGMYFLANIIMISLSLALSAVTITLWEKSKRAGLGVPSIIDKIFNGIFGRLFCVRREDYIEDDDPSGHTSGTHASSNASTQIEDSAAMVREYNRLVAPAEWRQLSVVLDRLLLVVLLAVWAIMSAVLLHFRNPFK